MSVRCGYEPVVHPGVPAHRHGGRDAEVEEQVREPLRSFVTPRRPIVVPQTVRTGVAKPVEDVAGLPVAPVGDESDRVVRADLLPKPRRLRE